MGLPVQSCHLNAASPAHERIKVVRCNPPSVGIYSHHVSHIVSHESSLVLDILGVLNECSFHEREDVIVGFALGIVESTELDSGAVDSQLSQDFDDVAGFVLSVTLAYFSRITQDAVAVARAAAETLWTFADEALAMDGAVAHYSSHALKAI